MHPRRGIGCLIYISSSSFFITPSRPTRLEATHLKGWAELSQASSRTARNACAWRNQKSLRRANSQRMENRTHDLTRLFESWADIAPISCYMGTRSTPSCKIESSRQLRDRAQRHEKHQSPQQPPHYLSVKKTWAKKLSKVDKVWPAQAVKIELVVNCATVHKGMKSTSRPNSRPTT
jgi:hypothetical protein